jgi:hypothetical protein
MIQLVAVERVNDLDRQLGSSGAERWQADETVACEMDCPGAVSVDVFRNSVLETDRICGIRLAKAVVELRVIQE